MDSDFKKRGLKRLDRQINDLDNLIDQIDATIFAGWAVLIAIPSAMLVFAVVIWANRFFSE